MAGGCGERTADTQGTVAMSKFVLDTNAVIALLKGSHRVNDMITDAEWEGISVITKLEYLSFSDLTDEDIELFSSFENRVAVIDLADAHRLQSMVQIMAMVRIRQRLPGFAQRSGAPTGLPTIATNRF